MAKRLNLIKELDNKEFINFFNNEIKSLYNIKDKIIFSSFDYTMDFNRLNKKLILKLIDCTKNMYNIVLKVVSISKNQKINANILEQNINFDSFES